MIDVSFKYTRFVFADLWESQFENPLTLICTPVLVAPSTVSRSAHTDTKMGIECGYTYCMRI